MIILKKKTKHFTEYQQKDGEAPNLSLIYDYYSISSYLSLGNEYIYNLAKELEINKTTLIVNMQGLDERAKITTLLSTKYFITDKKNISYVPYGYSLCKTIENTYIYKNNNYLPIGLVYDSYILKEQYNELSPLQKEDAIITTAVLENEIDSINKYENIEENLSNITSLSYTVNDDNILKDNKIKTKSANQSIELEIHDLKPNTEIYLSIKNLKYITSSNDKSFSVRAVFNGVSKTETTKDPISTAYYEENPDYLINLGKIVHTSNNKIKIIFKKIGTYTFDSLEILEVPMDKYEKKIDKLQDNQMTDIEWGNNFIKGKISTDTNGILQITTSYSDGWKAFVDGNEVEVINVNGGFIGIPVEAGEHEIEFKYTTPFLNLGIICTVLGCIRFYLYCYL